MSDLGQHEQWRQAFCRCGKPIGQPSGSCLVRSATTRLPDDHSTVHDQWVMRVSDHQAIVERERIERTTAHGGVVPKAHYEQIMAVLEENANVGDRHLHGWAYICNYCAKCSDERLEHNPDCILASRPKLDSAPGPVLDSGRGK